MDIKLPYIDLYISYMIFFIVIFKSTKQVRVISACNTNNYMYVSVTFSFRELDARPCLVLHLRYEPLPRLQLTHTNDEDDIEREGMNYA